MKTRARRRGRAESLACLYMYCDGESLVFLDPRSFEQHFLPLPAFEEKRAYLKEGGTYRLVLWRGKALALELPRRLGLRVLALGAFPPPDSALPAVDSGSLAEAPRVPGATRPVTTETGLIVRVPFFIKPGDLILVDSGSNEFIERLEAAQGEGRSGPPA